MARNYLKLDSTNVVDLPDVYDAIGGFYLTNLNATASSGALLDANKLALSPPVVLTWAYVANTNGTWRTTIADTIALTDRTAYYAKVKLTVTASGVVRTVYVPLVTKGDDN